MKTEEMLLRIRWFEAEMKHQGLNFVAYKMQQSGMKPAPEKPDVPRTWPPIGARNQRHHQAPAGAKSLIGPNIYARGLSPAELKTRVVNSQNSAERTVTSWIPHETKNATATLRFEPEYMNRMDDHR